MSFAGFIARKHLMHRKKTGFISLISVFSVLGVGLGVMALIVVLAVMTGFNQELKAKVVNVQPHLRIMKFGGVTDPAADMLFVRQHQIPGLKNVSQFVEGQALLRSEDNATGVIVKGLDVPNEDLSIYAKHVVMGDIDFTPALIKEKKRRFLFFHKTVEKEVPGIVLGETLAAGLRVQVGEKVNLITPFRDKNKSQSLLNVQSNVFVVRGIFRVGMNDFDTSLVLTDLQTAQKLFHLGTAVSGISLRFRNVDDAEVWKYRLRENFSMDYDLRSWYDMNQTFFQALKVEKSMLTILLALIILVAAFNIVSIITMIIMEKTKDIGILRAIGVTPGGIRKIFVIEGFSIGFVGIILGTISGLALAFNLNPVAAFIKQTTGIEVFPSDIYYFDRIPAVVNAEDVVVIVSFALVASILAGLYPAHRAAHLNPVEALHYE